MIELELKRPRWIKGTDDDPEDQCAHGCIRCVIDGLVISDGTEEWAVSAAALFLLRTVSFNHSENNSVAEENYLIPCCGFNPVKIEGGKFSLLLMGCNHGVNPEVTHKNEAVLVTFNGEKRSVSRCEWAAAIVKFTDQVLAFYKESSPKEQIADQYSREGWELFWQELRKRTEEARSIVNCT